MPLRIGAKSWMASRIKLLGDENLANPIISKSGLIEIRPDALAGRGIEHLCMILECAMAED
jgi:hypothetical protein